MSKYIFCDIDSTLHDYGHILSEAVFDLHGIKIDNMDATLHHYGPVLKEAVQECSELDNIDMAISQEQIAEAIQLTNKPSYIEKMIPYSNSLDIINHWKDSGHTVKYLTARNHTAYTPLLCWLIKHGFIDESQRNRVVGASDLFCLNSIDRGGLRMGSSDLKIELAVTMLTIENKIGIIVDDNPKVLKLASYTVDLLPATILHPWNKPVVDEYNIPSGKNWIELSSQLSKVYGLKRFKEVSPKHLNHKKAV